VECVKKKEAGGEKEAKRRRLLLRTRPSPPRSPRRGRNKGGYETESKNAQGLLVCLFWPRAQGFGKEGCVHRRRCAAAARRFSAPRVLLLRGAGRGKIRSLEKAQALGF
jgi:hypothetical protein